MKTSPPEESMPAPEAAGRMEGTPPPCLKPEKVREKERRRRGFGGHLSAEQKELLEWREELL